MDYKPRHHRKRSISKRASKKMMTHGQKDLSKQIEDTTSYCKEPDCPEPDCQHSWWRGKQCHCGKTCDENCYQFPGANNARLREIRYYLGKLILPDQILEPYDVQITGRGQVDALQETVLPALAAIWNNYAQVIVIMGAQYLKVINPILKRQGKWKMDPNVILNEVHDERGIGGLMQKVKELILLAKIPGIRWCHFHPVQRCKYWGCSCHTCEFRPPQTPEFYPTSEEIELKIPRPETRRDYVQGYYTRIQRPDLCSACPHGADSFNPKRHAALNNGNDNPASTACDYCCVWDDLIPDHLPCTQCGESGHLRRTEHDIICDNCQKVHQHLTEETKMAEQPKEPKPVEKKAETKEPEPSEFGRICGGCKQPIKPGTKNMVQDPHTKEWFHAEHYGQDERHQAPEDQYECIACNKEFPEGEMHRDRDGETWCKACWAAEHPPKKRAKKEKAAASSSKVLKLKGTWIYLDDAHLNELDEKTLGEIIFSYAIKCPQVGPTKAEMIANILAAPVGGVMGEDIEGKTTPFQMEMDAALYPGVKAICDACHKPIYRDQGLICQGSMTPCVPFHPDCYPKREILNHCLFDCAKMKECAVRYVKGCKEFASKVSKEEQVELGEVKQALTEKGQALAGMRLYQIFAMHAAQIAPLLSKEEQVEMNTLAEALSIE